MKIAIIYKSNTGNTKIIAEEIGKNLGNKVTYIGEPKENIEADVYFVGSWTDKGDCVNEISEFLKKLNNKKIAYFSTCGFGGSEEYYEKLFKRVRTNINETNEILGYFICQGKMPMSVKQRYIDLIKAHPEDKNLEVSIRNFDEALKHPNETDLKNLNNWVNKIVEKIIGGI